MYYVEEIIDGVLCYRLSPEDEWHPVDIKTATKKIIELQEQVKKLTTKCSLVEIDREILQVCIDMYKSGEKITAIKWLIEEAKKVEFEQVEKKGLKVVFGLEAQGHIPTIQAEIKRWNDSYKEQFPNEEPLDMTYSKHVWDGVGKIIGWCPFTAALSYFEWLNKANQ